MTHQELVDRARPHDCLLKAEADRYDEFLELYREVLAARCRGDEPTRMDVLLARSIVYAAWKFDRAGRDAQAIESLVEGTGSWAEKRRQMYLDLEDRNRVRDQAVELIKATRRLENALVLPGGTVLPFPRAVNE